jgi:hypothetical protein
MAGAKLLDERRARRRSTSIRSAISGNICRCTGYRKILDAMTEGAAELRAHEPLPRGSRSAGVSLIGSSSRGPTRAPKSPARRSIRPTSCGRGMLRLQRRSSRRAHAAIVRSTRARGGAGRRRVLTARDVPYNRYGLIDADQECCAASACATTGDRVALVDRRRRAPPPRGRAGRGRVRGSAVRRRRAGGARARTRRSSIPTHGTNVLLHQKIPQGRRRARLRAGRHRARRARSPPRGKSTRTCSPTPASRTTKARRSSSKRPGSGCTKTAPDRRDAAARRRRVAIRYAKIGGAFGGREDLSVQPLLALATWKHEAPDGDRVEPRRVDRRPPQAPSVSHHHEVGREARRHDRRGRDPHRRRRRRVRVDQHRSAQVRDDLRAGAVPDPNVATDGSSSTPTTSRAARSAASARRRRTGRPSR